MTLPAEREYPYKKQDEICVPGLEAAPGIVVSGMLLMAVRPPMYRPSHSQAPMEARREHDQRRGSARQRGYDSRWDREAKRHLMVDPLCRGCMAVGRYEAAAVVDHVEPHGGDREKFWSASMWQSSCRWHHDVVKQKLERQFAQGRLGVADLWLDSEAAKALTLSLQAGLRREG